MMKNQDYTYRFETSETAENIFKKLLQVEQWWSGIFSETIAGKSHQVNDEFTFHAGEGAHYSKQILVELIPNKKIAWSVIDSKLTFLEHPQEWTGTRLLFDIASNGGKQEVTFTHEGLVPKAECYGTCTDAWSQYMKNLENNLNLKQNNKK